MVSLCMIYFQTIRWIVQKCYILLAWCILMLTWIRSTQVLRSTTFFFGLPFENPLVRWSFYRFPSYKVTQLEELVLASNRLSLLGDSNGGNFVILCVGRFYACVADICLVPMLGYNGTILRRYWHLGTSPDNNLIPMSGYNGTIVFFLGVWVFFGLKQLVTKPFSN